MAPCQVARPATCRNVLEVSEDVSGSANISRSRKQDSARRKDPDRRTSSGMTVVRNFQVQFCEFHEPAPDLDPPLTPDPYLPTAELTSGGHVRKIFMRLIRKVVYAL
ncbi:hypothetical protein Bbelb_328820 [Branchiostoma belcheri]|nr:hypothetical protein Bbelb_328820 [Branchiostoma belcheri]